jgi:hypothetical protein
MGLVFDELPDSLLKYPVVKWKRVASYELGIESGFDGFKVPYSRNKGLDRGLVEKYSCGLIGLAGGDSGLALPRFPVGHHRFQGAAAGQGDHRPTHSLRFQRGDAEVVFSGKQEGPASGVKGPDLLAGKPAGEPDGCFGPPFKSAGHRPFAYNDERITQFIAGFNR